MLEYAFSALAGFLVKLTDLQVDDALFFASKFEYVTSIIAGAISGYLISAFPAFSTVFVAVIVANFVVGRFDKKAHKAMLVPLLLIVAIRGIFPPVLPLLLLFTFFAFFDEYLNDRYKKMENKVVHFIAKNRLSLEFAALAASIYAQNYSYFAAILSFDLGYLASEELFG